MGEAFRSAGEIVLQHRGVFLRHRSEGWVAVEVLNRISVFDQGEVVPFVRGHLSFLQSQIALARLSAPAAGLLQTPQLLSTPRERLVDADPVKGESGCREFRVMGERLREVAARLRVDRLKEIGHGPPKSVGGYQAALRSRPTFRGLPRRARASGT